MPQGKWSRMRKSGRDFMGTASVQRVLSEEEKRRREVEAGRRRMRIRGKGPHREEDPANRKVGGAVFATKAVVDYHSGSRTAELSCGHRKRYRYLSPPYFMGCDECAEAERTLIVEQMLKRPRPRWKREGKELPETVPEVKLFGGKKGEKP